jgi:hypothetical protein
MRFKAPDVEITPDAPFKNDALERSESAEVLTQFVSQTSTPFVLAIDSPWGTGKTTFLKMWSHVLHKAGFKCLFFNAWENDFSDSPLVSLIGEVGASLKHLGLTGDKKSRAADAFEKTKKIGASLLKSALPTAIKLATSGLLDLEKIDAKDFAEFTEKVAKKQIEKYEHDKESIRGFRKSLSEFVATVSERNKEAAPKPVIFIVDELDRCRPDYAIELLEKIKHLFNAQGLVFVLAMDMQQLGESIKAVYGGGLNADGYLRRFIDLHYQLPAPNVDRFVSSLFARFELEEAFRQRHPHLQYEATRLREVLEKLFPLFAFSLRVQEQCFTTIAVAIRTTPAGGHLYPLHLGLLVCLRAGNKAIYDQYVKGEATPEMVLKFLRGLPGGNEAVSGEWEALLEAHLVMGIRDLEKRAKAVHVYAVAGADDRRSTAGYDKANWVREAIRNYCSDTRDMTGYIYKKIEIANRFLDSPTPQ